MYGRANATCVLLLQTNQPSALTKKNNFKQASRYVSELEEMMVPADYRVKVPEEYSNLPQLQVWVGWEALFIVCFNMSACIYV